MSGKTVGIVDRKPRVLIVDNEPQSRISYQMLLLNWGYEVVLAMGSGKSLFEDAKNKARDKRCALALIDLRLFDDRDDDDTSGLKLADELPAAIRPIILSGRANQRDLREMLSNHKDLVFISKSDPRERMQQTLDKEAQKISASKREIKLDRPEIIEGIAHSPLGILTGEYPDQFVDVLARLFPDAKNLRLEKLDSTSASSNISTAPRPTSVVLKVYEENYEEPRVVKIARSEKIEDEVNRYNKYIARRLTGSFAPRLERNAVSWDVGGASYSYVGDFDVKTFSSYYEENSLADIEECLKSFFDDVWGRHYLQARELSGVSLFKIYSLVWGDWYEKRVKTFSAVNPVELNAIHKDFQVPDPVEWIKTKVAESANDISRVAKTRVAVTHGDLHGDNLLIDRKKNAWVIDFERCGEGHALQDFVELEADILNRLEASNDNFPAYIRMCLDVLGQKTIQEFKGSASSSGDARIEKAMQVTFILRSLAFRCTRIDDAREYLFGLLFNMLFRATIDPSKRHQRSRSRALMLASIICHRLDHWDDPWPPEEWKKLL